MENTLLKARENFKRPEKVVWSMRVDPDVKELGCKLKDILISNTGCDVSEALAYILEAAEDTLAKEEVPDGTRAELLERLEETSLLLNKAEETIQIMKQAAADRELVHKQALEALQTACNEEVDKYKAEASEALKKASEALTEAEKAKREKTEVLDTIVKGIAEITRQQKIATQEIVSLRQCVVKGGSYERRSEPVPTSRR